MEVKAFYTASKKIYPVIVIVPTIFFSYFFYFVKKGLYKNRSEVVIDALRHFLGSEKKSGISLVIEQQLKGKSEQNGCSKEELDKLWDKVRRGNEWKKRFGESPDEVIATLRPRR